MDDPEPHVRLADDLRRLADLLDACVPTARRLRLPVPPNVDACLETLREWDRAVRDRGAGS
jgi:hypothetical protein